MQLPRRIVSLGMATALGALASVLGACSSDVEGEAVGQTQQLLLLGDGTSIQLQGSLVDPNYRPFYPLRAVEKMIVTIDPRTGKLDAACGTDGFVKSCPDVPFFGRLGKDPSGKNRVIVKDRNGVVCADLPASDANASTGAQSAGTGSSSGANGGFGSSGGSNPDSPGAGSDDGTRGNGAPGTASGGNGSAGNNSNGFGGNGSGGDGSGSEGGNGRDNGTSGGSSATCSGAGVDALRTQFRAEVNAWLKDKNVRANNALIQIDCSKLDTVMPDYMPPGTEDNDLNCKDINLAAYEKAESAVGSCSNEAQARVENWESASRWQLLKLGACSGSPLVLDLDGNGIELQSFSDGPRFDLLGTGRPVQTGWISAGDALLVLDRNNDGRIDGGRELFGTATAGRKYADGFQALAELDLNKDGRIDRRDPGFEELAVWRDDGDGQSSPSELSSLRANGIKAIELAADHVSGVRSFDRHGNSMPLVSRFIRDDGREGLIGDVFFRFRTVDSSGNE